MTELNEIACLETARNGRLCAGAEHYLKVIAELRAERNALKDEVERLRQWYADSHRIIDEWDAKCSALRAEVGRYRNMIEEAAQMAESYEAHPYNETVGEVVRILRAEPPEQVK